MRIFDRQQRAPQDLTSPTFKVSFHPYRRLLYCQHEQGSVILKLRAAELSYLREQLLINPRGEAEGPESRADHQSDGQVDALVAEECRQRFGVDPHR